jgi:hypothetical protein
MENKIKKIVKRSILLLLIQVILLNSYVYATNNKSVKANNYTIRINGELIETPQKPIMKNNMIIVPFETILDKMGYKVEHDGNMVRCIKDDSVIVIQNNNKTGRLNGKLITLDPAPEYSGGVELVPISFVEECTGLITTIKKDSQILFTRKKYNPNNNDLLKAKQLSGELGITEEELIKSLTTVGDWEKVIFKVISSQKDKEVDKAEQLKKCFYYTTGDILKIKYQLGDWSKVFRYLYEERYKIKDDQWIDFENYFYHYNRMDLHRATLLAVLCDTTPAKIMEMGMKPGLHDYSERAVWWSDIIKKLDYKISLLDAARYLGATEEKIQFLKGSGYNDLEVLLIVKDSAESNKTIEEFVNDLKSLKNDQYDNYTKSPYLNFGDPDVLFLHYFSQRNFVNHYATQPKVRFDIDISDLNDSILKRELNITDKDIKKYNNLGFVDFYDIAKLINWGVTEDWEIKAISEKCNTYKISLDKLNDIRMRYISWRDITSKLIDLNGK